MLEIRIRVLDVGGGSFLGIVEGFPHILVHSTTAGGAEADAVRALEDWLERQMDREATRLQLDDFPTVRMSRVFVAQTLG